MASAARPRVAASRCCRILAYGDSLTAGYYNQGTAFSPYSDALAPLLCGAAATGGGGGGGGSPEQGKPPVIVDVCGASGLAAVELVQTLDTKILYDVCDREYQGLRYLLKKKASTTRVAGMYDAALIMLGTNDLAKMELSAGDILTAITELHTLCHSYGLRTVALPIPPNRFSSMPARGREDLVQYQARRERVNCLLKEWAEASAQANRVLFVDVTDSLPEWSEDGECWESDGLHFSAAGSQRLGELLGADESLKRYLLGDAYAAAASPGPGPEPEPEPEPEQSAAAAPLRAVVLPPAEEILAADAREVAYQTGVSEPDARAALARNGYEMVPAVMELNDQQQRRSRG